MKSLEPDWQRATSLAVYAIYTHLNSTDPALFPVPNPLSFRASSGVLWTHGLWLTSFTLSLVVSLLAILAKQWLSEFKLRMRAPASSPRMWALRHTAYKGGLDRWGIGAFISVIPVVLHVALFLFLVGLCLQLQPLDVQITRLVVAITGLVCLFYLVAGLAPLFWGDCPSATPGLRYLCTLWNEFIVIAVIRLSKIWINATTMIIFFVLKGICICCVLVVMSGGLVLSVVPSLLGISSRWMEFGTNTAVDLIYYVNRILNGRIAIQRAVAQYRRKSAGTPAFDQSKLLATDIPFREASALSWMIRMQLPDDDIIASLCAVGCLSEGDHHDYFHSKGQASPLTHEDVQRAVEVALERIAAQQCVADVVTTASLLRACVSVSLRPPRLSLVAKRFLWTLMSVETYNIGKFSRFICSNVVTAVQDVCLDPQWSIGRLAFIACTMSEPQNQNSIASAIQSLVRGENTSRQSSSRIDDSRLEELIRLDSRFFSSSQSTSGYWLGPRTISDYSAAAKQVELNCVTGLPQDLQDQLHFITTPNFLGTVFSVDTINNLAAIILRANDEGLTCIRPLVLRHLLCHFEYTDLPVQADTLQWIQAAFQLSHIHINRTLELWRYFPAELILPGSHLSLLQPVPISQPVSRFERPYDRVRARTFVHTTTISSPWRHMLSLMPMFKTAQVVSEMACAYSILLLAMHRRGFPQVAQAMLRELLPFKQGIIMIAHGTRSRYHLALDTRFVEEPLWEQLAEGLVRPTEDVTWTACEKYADAGAFVDAITAQNDCLECPHGETEVEAGWAALLTSMSDPKSEEVDQNRLMLVTAATAEPISESTESLETPEKRMQNTQGGLAEEAAEEDEKLEKGQWV